MLFERIEVSVLLLMEVFTVTVYGVFCAGNWRLFLAVAACQNRVDRSISGQPVWMGSTLVASTATHGV